MVESYMEITSDVVVNLILAELFVKNQEGCTAVTQTIHKLRTSQTISVTIVGPYFLKLSVQNKNQNQR